MKKTLFFIAILLLLLAIEVAKVYFIMPFPGSQWNNNIKTAYWLHTNIWYLRLGAWLLLAFPAYSFLSRGKWYVRILTVIGLLIYGFVFYLFNFRFMADKMFYQPETKVMAPLTQNTIPAQKLVVGVVLNGEARAYPVEIIGYHHQVRDTIGKEPIMITYCTVCRSARVFSPKVNGKEESFRLVGMDLFNAMFEDATTHSWWRQETGEAIAGPLKGKALDEMPFEQTTLQSWALKHPETKVLQPDPKFLEEYKHLEGFDNGTRAGSLEGTDTTAWARKAWVVGITIDNISRAYDWRDLLKQKTINDTLNQIPLLITVEPDSLSFGAWMRSTDGDVFDFSYDPTLNALVDKQTQSRWNFTGVCYEGQMKGAQLQPIQAYQEFWHSWESFHPNTSQYKR